MYARISVAVMIVLFGFMATLAVPQYKIATVSEKTLRGWASHTVMPAFPEASRNQKSQGVAVVQLDIDEQGKVTKVDVLEAPDAIKKWRDTMGATNPANAAEGTIRKLFAKSIERNCVHGSDAPETAAVEIPFFFSAAELL